MMTQDQVGGVVRALLTALGGYFVGQGLVDANTVAIIAGSAATLAGAAWSIYTNRPAKIQKV